jgi:hypothetical protein
VFEVVECCLAVSMSGLFGMSILNN